MEFKITKETKFISIKSVGKIDELEEYKALSKKYYDIIIESSFRLAIIDETEIELPLNLMSHVKLVDYYQQDEIFTEIRFLKVAVIPTPQHKEISDFWALYASNRGLNFKVFDDFEKAKLWLLQ